MRENGVIEDSNNHFVDNATRAKLNMYKGKKNLGMLELYRQEIAGAFILGEEAYG